MRKRFRAALAPAVIGAATGGAAGFRALDSGSGRRLDELSAERPAAATHFPQRAPRPRTKVPAPTGRGGGSGGSCAPGSIVQRESIGDPNAVSPSTGSGGKYQFLPSTWDGHGGYARAQDAPESVQDERFDGVWAGGAGSSHWGC